MAGLALVLLIVCAVCFVFILAISYKTDARVVAAAAVGLLLTLLLLFNVA